MKDYEAAMLKWISQEVCDDLFAAASADNKIMVNNWVAFATLAIYREAASILDTIPVPSIDDCMAGAYEPPDKAENPKWEQLEAWHREHWCLSQIECMEDIYAPYIAMPELCLDRFTLCL